MEQLHTAIAAGCTVSGYIWCYWDLAPIAHVRDALKVLEMAKLTPADVGMIWLDVEDTRTWPRRWLSGSQWLRDAIWAVKSAGYRPGIYTGKWFWDGYMKANFSEYPLWAAQYDGIPDLESVILFGGWTRERLWGKQYSSEGVDQNVFRPEVLPGGGP